MAEQNAYFEGIRLFNDGHYWHAHEQWEQCWLAATEPDATLYKGLIQAAAALVHWQKANPRGLHLNWAKARPRLLAVSDHIRSLQLSSFIRNMDAFVMNSASEGYLAAPVLVQVSSITE